MTLSAARAGAVAGASCQGPIAPSADTTTPCSRTVPDADPCGCHMFRGTLVEDHTPPLRPGAETSLTAPDPAPRGAGGGCRCGTSSTPASSPERRKDVPHAVLQRGPLAWSTPARGARCAGGRKPTPTPPVVSSISVRPSSGWDGTGCARPSIVVVPGSVRSRDAHLAQRHVRGREDDHCTELVETGAGRRSRCGAAGWHAWSGAGSSASCDEGNGPQVAVRSIPAGGRCRDEQRSLAVAASSSRPRGRRRRSRRWGRCG